MTVGYLAHGFDLLNVGDLDVIAQVRAQCSRLVVGVLSDQTVERATGRPPVVPLVERLALVGYLRGVDEVTVHDDTSVDRYQPGAIFAVGDSRPEFAGDQAILVTPGRITSSEALQHALRSWLVSSAA